MTMVRVVMFSAALMLAGSTLGAQVAARLGHWKGEPDLREIIHAADTVSVQQRCA